MWERTSSDKLTEVVAKDTTPMSNRLSEAQSLYLRKHAANPIDWRSWTEEALIKAKSEDKPIFLSIGYSSCHWCTVMEGEAFSDPAIAEYMNANFMPLKVDREERPDIDSIYMQALEMMTGQGGWPLNIFLTPGDLIPFFGGTYFPVEPRYNRRGFLQILQLVRRFYDREKGKLQQYTEEISGLLQKSTILPPSEIETLTTEILHRGMETNTKLVANSPQDFGRPRFPTIPYARLALASTRFVDLENNLNGAQICQQRGLDLALGGIYDHVGGGFHRYTVDSTWTVPHFEKMLYDNGLNIEYLANLWSSGYKSPAITRAIAKTVKWLEREMTAPEGYFYASQDADNFTTFEAKEPEEGDFYVWEYADLEKLLSPEELSELKGLFTINAEGNFEGKNVLQRAQDGEFSDNIENILELLFTVRYGKSSAEIHTFTPAKNNQEAKSLNWDGRIPPVTDTKAIVAWNSLVISGLARAYGVFKEESYLKLATNAANCILDRHWQENSFYRLNYDGQASVLAQSEDYAFFIKALLDLQVNCLEDNIWLEKALAMQRDFDRKFWSEDEGGYYNNALDAAAELSIKERSYLDNATPAANGIAIANLVRLALLTDNLEYIEKAKLGLQAFSIVLEKSPQACPSLFVALDWYLYGVSVSAKKEELQTLIEGYFPTTVYKIKSDLADDAVGLVCQNMTCLKPAETREELLAQITKSQV